jgi:hypothetical protein
MAVKSFVNDDVEMLGVEDADDDVEEVVALALELALEDELLLLLPQPAATAATTKASTDTRNQLNLITARSSHRRAKVNTDQTLTPVNPARNTLSNGAAAVHLH